MEGPGFGVWHLIDEPAPARGADRPVRPDAALMGAALLRAADPGVRQTVCLIGGSALERGAREAGLPATDRIAPPMGWTRRADRGLRALLADRGRPRVVQCWSGATARLAARLRLPSCVIAMEDRNPVARTAVPVWVRRGGDSARAAPQVIGAPLPMFGLVGAKRRGDGLPVVLLLGGAPGEADAMRAVVLAGILAVAHARATWIVPEGAARLDRALRYHAKARLGFRVIVTDRPLAAQVAGADIAVWLGGACEDVAATGPTPGAGAIIASVLAAGVPVVAPRSQRTASLYSPGAAAVLLAHTPTLAEVARILLPLLLDRTGGSGMAAPLKADHGSRFEDVVADAWRICAGVDSRPRREHRDEDGESA